MKTTLISVFRVLILLAAQPAPAADTLPVTLYDKDPQHLWNRVYSGLMTHPVNGKHLPVDLLEPFGAGELRKEGEANKEAVALLGELVKGQPAIESMTVMQRAVMQRDLLTLFHLILNGESGYRNWTVPEREVIASLGRAIRHLALTEEAIRKLPDNYAAAVNLPDAVTTYDKEKPAAFLPTDLLADDGPWIGLDASTRVATHLAAPFHFKMMGGRASFEVRFKHPDGRAAGEAYLKALAAMPEPWVRGKIPPEKSPVPNASPGSPVPHPDTPQFPAGTAWALVRRSILADATGKAVVSPLVESVQIRVYRNVSWEEASNSPEFKKRTGEAQEDGDLAAQGVYQTMIEWKMQRALLLGKGGFHLTGPEDVPFSAFAHSDKPIPVSLFCMQCHSAAGIHSVNSRSTLFSMSAEFARPPEFQPATRKTLDWITEGAARPLTGWVMLQWLWQDTAAR